MRLRRLDLTRYGKFTGTTIDFGETVAGQPDFHIIYGPNEAGKSTAVSAYLDFLFGIERNSRFNFLHPWPAMRIGACLEIAGRPHELCRVKRPQGSLLDSADDVVAEPLLLAPLGGIDRKSYQSMFSLDDFTLEEGGQNILASRGDLGELLFSAAAGLSDFSRQLAALREKADGFYRPRARSGTLADQKARIADLRARRQELDVGAAAHARLVERRDQANALYEKAIAQRSAIQARMDDVRRMVSALPRLAKLRVARNELAPLADLPEPPAAWHQDVDGLRLAETRFTTQSEESERAIAEQQAALQAIIVNEAALRLADRVDGWDDLRAPNLVEDILKQQAAVSQADLTIAGKLARIGRTGHPNPRELLLPVSTVHALRTLIEARSGVAEALRGATQARDEARRQLDDATSAMGPDPADAAHMADKDSAFENLAMCIRIAQAGDHVGRLIANTRAYAEAAAEATQRLSALEPWQGSLDELAALSVPDEARIEHWHTLRDALQQQHDVHAARATDLHTERIRLAADLETFANIAGLVSDSEASAIRAAREQAWAAHRRTLSADTADAFETALRHDDIVTNARLRHEAEISRLHRTQESLSRVTAEAARADHGRSEAAASLAGLQNVVAMAVAAITTGVAPETGLAWLQSWRARRAAALETRARLKRAEQDLHTSQQEADQARRQLLDALRQAGVTHLQDATVELLLAAGQAALDRHAAARLQRAEVQNGGRRLRQLEEALARSAAAERDWAEGWEKLCGTCWLGTLGAPVPVGTVSEILDILAELAAAIFARDEALSRIHAMQLHQANFTAEVNRAAAELGLDTDNIATIDLDRRITRLVQDARTARDLRDAGAKALWAAQENCRAVQAARNLHNTKCAEMTDFFGVTAIADVEEKLRAVARRADLRRQAEEAEHEILDALRATSIGAAEALLDEADHAALDAELAELQARFEDHDKRVRELFAEYCKAEDSLAAIGGDAAVAQLEEQRTTVLLEIEDGAHTFLKLRAGIAAAERALRAYRQQHRSAMMARASEVFRAISENAYTGLASQPEQDREVLVALPAEGGSKIATELSKGTRFQLYLALRVAGYHEFVAHREPVPFIADDILETFDNPRSAATFRVFAGMGQVGQVIYLTHHQHLCDIATNACPGVRVHTLQP